MRISHLGPTGTYTEAAARRFDPTADLLPLATVSAAIQAVRDGQADAAVCAMENSIEGSVSIETMDILIGPEFELRVCGEVVVAIQHHLVGAPGINAAAATKVYSHPQGLAQCRQRLNQLAPNAQPVAALSTAGAVEASIKEPGTLAVGSEYAAELYGASIYARDIGDERDNETRFVVLSKEDAAPTGDDKTSLAFTVAADRPGSLVEVLQLFAQHGINLTRIESRPTRRQLGTYVFFCDVQGHRSDAVVRGVLEETAQITQWLRVLGSYPRWRRA